MSGILRMWSAALDFLFPPECLGCGNEDVWVCDACRSSIRNEVKRLSIQPKPFAHVWVLADYHQSLVAKAVRRLKFGYSRDVLRDLQPFFKDALADVKLPTNTVLVPVPLHRRRLNTRGFNQAELFAEQIAAIIGVRIIPLLKRTRHTPPQTKMNGEERRKNLKGAFTVDEKIAAVIAQDIPLIIVDDVATTMTTLEECGRTLTKAGYAKLNALVIARSAELNK